MLSEHDFLSPEDCKRDTRIVHSLREYWVNRAGSFLPFFTLGAVSYLDAPKNDPTRYLQAAQKYNPILMSHFPQLYETLKDTLSDILHMPVSFANDIGLPGFHIFLSSKCFESPIASVHFDVQYEALKWDDYDKVDFDHPISFTCPIVLPSSGAGLNYWDIGEEAKDMEQDAFEKLKASKEQHFFPYKLGKLILHKGLTLHQIAPCVDMKPDDERITLQGHGLVCDGIMRLYW